MPQPAAGIPRGDRGRGRWRWPLPRACRGRACAFLKPCLSLAKAGAMGLQSGLVSGPEPGAAAADPARLTHRLVFVDARAGLWARGRSVGARPGWPRSPRRTPGRARARRSSVACQRHAARSGAGSCSPGARKSSAWRVQPRARVVPARAWARAPGCPRGAPDARNARPTPERVRSPGARATPPRARADAAFSSVRRPRARGRKLSPAWQASPTKRLTPACDTPETRAACARLQPSATTAPATRSRQSTPYALTPSTYRPSTPLKTAVVRRFQTARRAIRTRFLNCLNVLPRRAGRACHLGNWRRPGSREKTRGTAVRRGTPERRSPPRTPRPRSA